MSRTIDHLRHNVVAYLALFVALGGTSYAAIKLPSNSVGSKQLRKNAVTPSKVHPKTRALFKGQRGAAGLPGASGAPGAPGAPGAQGQPGPTASGSATAGGSTAITTSSETYISLGSADATHSGPVSVGFAARLVADASVRMFKPTTSGDVAGQAFCQLELGSAGVYTQFGSVAVVTFEKTDAGQVVFRQLPVTGAVDVGAGTYDVRVRCSRRDLVGPPALNAPVSFQGADLTVVAAAR